jgi:MFS family permease
MLPPSLTPRHLGAGRWVLAITVLGSGIASLDATVVNIALPTIVRDFHTGVAALQWVMNGYTLTPHSC